MHLAFQHLLVVCASANPTTSAAALWLDCNNLSCNAKLALPAKISHAWTDYSLQQAVISTRNGDVLSIPIVPEVWQLELVVAAAACCQDESFIFT